jgi:RimJ/RimL family protein N-acetyltransferase
MEFELRGARLRPFRLEDAESVARQANDHSVWRNLTDGFPFPYTPGDFVAFFTRLKSEAEAHPESKAHVFAFEVGGEAVGACGVHPLTDVYRKGALVGYWLGAPSPPRRCGC